MAGVLWSNHIHLTISAKNYDLNASNLSCPGLDSQNPDQQLFTLKVCQINVVI
jgi:hypothetical protein